MDCYNDFALIYDKLTYDIDYKKFVMFINDIMLKHGKNINLILELACGTGNMTRELTTAGYDVIGLDISPEMLNYAREKCPENLLLCQDMTDFELYGTVDAILCLLDSVNYITDEEKLLKMFKLVNNYLEYEGLFIFDINSEHKLRNIIGENTFVYNTDDIFYTWENEQEKDEVNFILNFFVKDSTGKYEKIQEYHKEKVYKLDYLVKIIEKAGLEYVTAYADFEMKNPTEKSQRIFVVARKQKA